MVEHAWAVSYPSTPRQCHHAQYIYIYIRLVMITNDQQFTWISVFELQHQPTQSPNALALVQVNVATYWTGNVRIKESWIKIKVSCVTPCRLVKIIDYLIDISAFTLRVQQSGTLGTARPLWEPPALQVERIHWVIQEQKYILASKGTHITNGCCYVADSNYDYEHKLAAINIGAMYVNCRVHLLPKVCIVYVFLDSTSA